MYGYIYLTVNLITGKKYIGKHRAEMFDPSYKGSGKYITRAFNKYGIENFSVQLLRKCNSLDELNDAEIEYIAQYRAVESADFYNLARGGEGNTSKRSNETIAKVRQSLTGRKLSEEHKRKVSESMRGIKHKTGLSDEHKAKISAANKGRVLSDEHKRKIVASRRKNNVCWVTETTKQKISATNKGKIPWNKGLTKETDSRVKRGYDNFHKTMEIKHNKTVVVSDI